MVRLQAVQETHARSRSVPWQCDVTCLRPAGFFSRPQCLRQWVQITLKPSAKGPRMRRIFVGGKGRKYVIADSALKPVQVRAWAFWLDADEHHRSFALRTGGA